MIDGITNHQESGLSPHLAEFRQPAGRASATCKIAQKGRHQTHRAQNRHDPRQITQAQRRYPASGCPKSESSEAIFVPRILHRRSCRSRNSKDGAPKSRPNQPTLAAKRTTRAPSLAPENTQRHHHESVQSNEARQMIRCVGTAERQSNISTAVKLHRNKQQNLSLFIEDGPEVILSVFDRVDWHSSF